MILQPAQADRSRLGTRCSLKSNSVSRSVEGNGAAAVDEKGVTGEQLGGVALLILHVQLT